MVFLVVIIGEVIFYGDVFKCQFELGYLVYIYVVFDFGCWMFGGLYYVFFDGVFGKYYWMFMKFDFIVVDFNYWFQIVIQQEKFDYVLVFVVKFLFKFREIYEVMFVSGIKQESYVWRDFELESLFVGWVVLFGDVVYVMMLFCGEGGYNVLIDFMKLVKILVGVDGSDIDVIKKVVEEYNKEMFERGVEVVCVLRGEQSVQKIKSVNVKVMSVGQEVWVLLEREIVLMVRG